MPKSQQYVTTLDEHLRLRTTIETENAIVIHWAVQLELYSPETEKDWIARYDTAGGTAHRDRHFIAAHESVPLPEPASTAIIAAQQDLTRYAVEYTEQYLEAKKLEEKDQ